MPFGKDWPLLNPGIFQIEASSCRLVSGMNVGLGFREEDVDQMLVAALNPEVRVDHLQLLSTSIAKQKLGEG